MKKNRIISILLLSVFVLMGIVFIISQFKPKPAPVEETQNSKPETQNSKPGLPSVSVPDFNADSAYSFIEKQVSFGPRIPGTPSQLKCADWFTEKLRSYTEKVYIQDLTVEIYNGKTVPCKNIIAAFNPDQPKRILLFAHWDTRPWSDQDSLSPRKSFDGADDGASGPGVLLELARHLSQQHPQVGVDIAFFDVEDYGSPKWEPVDEHREEGYCLGTIEWANTPHVPGYRAYYGILLDMVGARNATFLQEGVSLQNAPSIIQKVWGVAADLGYSNYFQNIKVPGIVDDHTYVNRFNATPSIDIIYLKPGTKTGFAPHWHTQQDNMSIIDKSTLKAVGQTLLQVVYTEPADIT